MTPTAAAKMRTALAVSSLLVLLPLSAAASQPAERLRVEFFSEPTDKLGVEEVSVQYGSKATSPEVKAEHFFQYSARIMFDLDEASPVFQVFVQLVLGGIDRGLTRETNVVETKYYRMKVVKPRSGAKKTCSAEFFPDKPAQMACSSGGEGYYGPMSVFAFLQHIVRTSSKDELGVITNHLRKRYSEMAQRKKALGDEKTPFTPERLVLHWVQSMAQCVQPDPSKDKQVAKAQMLLISRVLVARYLHMDIILAEKLGDVSTCRMMYIKDVNKILFAEPNKKEALDLFGQPYDAWFLQNLEAILAKAKAKGGEKSKSPLAYKLAMAAVSFDARFAGDKQVVLRISECLELDLEVADAVVKAAAGMCGPEL